MELGTYLHIMRICLNLQRLLQAVITKNANL